MRDARSYFFFLNDTATTEIYTLPLHDALPIFKTLEKLKAVGKIRHYGISIHDPQEGPLAIRDREEPFLWIVNRDRTEEHTAELQSPCNIGCRLLLEKKKTHTLCAPDDAGAERS